MRALKLLGFSVKIFEESCTLYVTNRNLASATLVLLGFQTSQFSAFSKEFADAGFCRSLLFESSF